MAVPSLPSDLATGATLTETWVDASRTMHGWFRDDRPIFKGQAWSAGGGGSIAAADATNVTFGFGTGGAFNFTPVINVGSWTVDAADADPESLLVPETGIYMLIASAEFGTSSAVGSRQIRILRNGSAIAGSRVEIDAGDTALTHSLIATCFQDFTATTDGIDVIVYQNSGSAMDVTVVLSAIWMQST